MLYQHFAAITIAVDLDHYDGVESLNDSQQCNGVLYSKIALVCQTTTLGGGHAIHPWSDTRLLCQVENSCHGHQMSDGAAAALLWS